MIINKKLINKKENIKGYKVKMIEYANLPDFRPVRGTATSRPVCGGYFCEQHRPNKIAVRSRNFEANFHFCVQLNIKF